MRLAPRPPCGTRSLRGSTTGHRSGGQPGGVQGSGLNVSTNGSPPTRPQRQIWGAGWRKPVRVLPGLFQNLPHTSAIEGTCRRQHRCVLQARDGPWHWARAGTSPQRVTASPPIICTETAVSAALLGHTRSNAAPPSSPAPSPHPQRARPRSPKDGALETASASSPSTWSKCHFIPISLAGK